MARIEFPKFNGDDLDGWVFKCDQFFEIDYTPKKAKVKIAFIHLESRALQWHQIYVNNRVQGRPIAWNEYVQALTTKFGVVVYKDSMSELKNLKQEGDIQEYIKSFEQLLNKVNLSAEYTISCFFVGLKDEIQMHVRMLYPKTLVLCLLFGQITRGNSINLTPTIQSLSKTLFHLSGLL